VLYGISDVFLDKESETCEFCSEDRNQVLLWSCASQSVKSTGAIKITKAILLYTGP